MISYRKADLIDRIKESEETRFVWFFNDDREQIKYYNPKTDTISDPKKQVSINYSEFYGSTWRRVDMDGCLVLIDGNVGSRMLGCVVMSGNEIIGNFDRITVDGLLHIKTRGGGEFFIDPTDYVIRVVHDHLIIKRNPV